MTKPLAGAPQVAPSDGGHDSLHAWERWAPAWNGVFFGLLGVSTALALADPQTSGARRAAIASLALALAGWYWIWAVRRQVWKRPLLQVIAYLAGAATLWTLLLVLHESFFIVAFSAYAQVFGFLPSPRSAVPGAVVLTALLLVMQGVRTEHPTPAPFLIAVSSAAAGILLSLWVDAIIRQSQDRHRLIEELEATRAELAIAERQAGTLSERQRLAGEIHDTLAQGFTSIVTLLEATEADLAPGQLRARRHLSLALDTARDNLGEARRFVWALQPEALERTSLSAALDRLGERLEDEAGVVSRVVVTGTPRSLSPQAEIVLLRAAQEGLANVRKHARANEAVLTLSYVGDRVILDVTDDGLGFDVAGADSRATGLTGGQGLRGLELRLAVLGGTLDIESTPGEGTALVAQLPIDPAGDEPDEQMVLQ